MNQVLSIKTLMTVAGQPRTVRWEDKTLTIEAVESWEQAQEILSARVSVEPPGEVNPPAPKAEPPLFPQSLFAPSAGPTPVTAAPAAPSASPPVSVAAASAADTSEYEPFRSMTLLGQVVNALLSQGFKDYAAILEQVKAIQASGVSPLLNRIANLEQRLQVTCSSLDVPGALG